MIFDEETEMMRVVTMILMITMRACMHEVKYDCIYCLGMFLSIRKTRRAAAQCGIKGDMAYAKRFFFIILTDSLCWLPIALLKIMSLCNYIISGESNKYMRF